MGLGFYDLIHFFTLKEKIYGYYPDLLSANNQIKIVIIFRDIGDMEVHKIFDIFKNKLPAEKENCEIKYDCLSYEVIRHNTVWKNSLDHSLYVLDSVQADNMVIMQSVISALVKKTSPSVSKYSIMEFPRLFKSTGKFLEDIELPSI